MLTKNQHGATAPGIVTASDRNDDCELGGYAGINGIGQTGGANIRGAPHAAQALMVIEGESKAADFLARLRAQQTDPDELALIVSALYGATLRGFCRVIEKALGGQHA